MKWMFLFMLFATASAMAEEEFKVYVNTFDPDLDTKSIESPKVEITKGSGKYKSHVAALPDPIEMEKIFVSVGLNTEIESLDQMERDILYRRVTERDLASVKERYPSLPPQKLGKLKAIIEARK